MNLQNNELDVLARFLGHDIRAHREFYRLPENTIEIVKTGQLLSSLNERREGDSANYSGEILLCCYCIIAIYRSIMSDGRHAVSIEHNATTGLSTTDSTSN